ECTAPLTSTSHRTPTRFDEYIVAVSETESEQASLGAEDSYRERCHMLNRLRNAGRDNLALVIFLGSYFVLTVAGNLLYLIPGGDTVGEIAIKHFRIESLKTSGTFGYLFLL